MGGRSEAVIDGQLTALTKSMRECDDAGPAFYFSYF